MSKVAALELGQHNIRVNSVHPGGMDTPLVAGSSSTALEGQPIARFADPVEVGNLVLFLASDEASYCTGAEYLADGGMMAGRVFPG
jgi:3alpha(or 20beta)-hydroxysteroid dehydrogenase